MQSYYGSIATCPELDGRIEIELDGQHFVCSTRYALENQPNTALFSLILIVGTYVIAERLHSLTDGASKLFTGSARRFLGQYGIAIALVIMSALAWLIGVGVYIQTLHLPKGFFQPTAADLRGWFVDPFVALMPGNAAEETSSNMMLAAVGPALLIFILLFVEVEITE